MTVFRVSVAIAVAAAILLLLTIVPSGRYYVVANDIKPPSHGAIDGSFTIRRSYLVGWKPGFPYITLAGGIATNGGGGACVLALPGDVGLTGLAGKHCTEQAHCATPGTEEGTPNPYRNWYGYCDVPTNKCWVRPGPPVPKDPVDPADATMANFCNRSGDYPPPPGKVWTAEVAHPAYRRPLNVAHMPPGNRQVRVRVSACLSDAKGVPCAQSVMGKVACVDRVTGGAC